MDVSLLCGSLPRVTVCNQSEDLWVQALTARDTLLVARWPVLIQTRQPWGRAWARTNDPPTFEPDYPVLAGVVAGLPASKECSGGPSPSSACIVTRMPARHVDEAETASQRKRTCRPRTGLAQPRLRGTQRSRTKRANPFLSYAGAANRPDTKNNSHEEVLQDSVRRVHAQDQKDHSPTDIVDEQPPRPSRQTSLHFGRLQLARRYGYLPESVT